MTQIIFKHIEDNNESVIFQGSKADCKAQMKVLKNYYIGKGFEVWGWCNGGFSISKTLYTEIR